MTCARVASSIRCDRSDVLIGRDLTRQLGQHGRITCIAGRDLDGPDLQRFFIDPIMYLAPGAPPRAAMSAGVPRAFPFGLDTGAVDEQGQRAGSTAIRQAHGLRSLTAAQGAEIRDSPVRPGQLQQAFHEASRLPQWQARQELECQAGLNRGVTALVLPTTFAARWWHPDHLRIKPDRT